MEVVRRAEGGCVERRSYTMHEIPLQTSMTWKDKLGHAYNAPIAYTRALTKCKKMQLRLKKIAGSRWKQIFVFASVIRSLRSSCILEKAKKVDL